MNPVGSAAQAMNLPDFTTAVHVVALAEGLYSLAVRPAPPHISGNFDITLPALHISQAPSASVSSSLELLPAPHLVGNWLTQPGDAIVARVSGSPCQILITSLTRPGVTPLSIEVRRLDQRGETAVPVSKPAAIAAPVSDAIVLGSNIPAAPVSTPPIAPIFDAGRRVLRSSVALHVQNRGDIQYDGDGWAGVIAEKLALEAYALTITEELDADAIDYRATTSSGFETPWLSKSAWCGTRGMGISLVGIAARLKPAAAKRYRCEYSAAFRSGFICKTVADGASCRSTEVDDPIIAIRLRIIERETSNDAADTAIKSAKRVVKTYR